MKSNEVDQTNVKQGALLGSLVCLLVGLGFMYFTLLSFFIYGPLFLAAFILSIVAMAQGRVAGGVILLIVTLVAPSVFGLVFFAERATALADSLSRETRVEGKVVPPGGMTLNNEVWIVSDFRELTSGIAEDLAAERKPLMQEIKERQEHVRQAQQTNQPQEAQQAEADLAQAQAINAGMDDKYYKQLDSLPGEAVTKHIPLATNGRFTWVDDDVFAEGEKEHSYWIFARATRADGRQYWALHHFSITKNQTLELNIEPTGFISTKAILRPDLSPDEQER